jgi:hypothetical protein
MTQTSRERNEALGALVGRWHTQGWTSVEAGIPSERIDAIDTYEWLPGEAALLHLVDATVGETGVRGAEIIGYDSDRRHYVTLYFSTDGRTAYEADLTETDDALVWEMRSADSRFRGSFDAGGKIITRSLGAPGRRFRVATVDGHHADEAGVVSRPSSPGLTLGRRERNGWNSSRCPPIWAFGLPRPGTNPVRGARHRRCWTRDSDRAWLLIGS